MSSTPSTDRRREILRTVEQAVCKDRQNTYSDAEDNFQIIAEFWTTWGKARGWNVQFESRDVAMMSALIKAARAGVNLDYLDNWVDLAGYSVCGGGIAKGVGEQSTAPKSKFVPTHCDPVRPELKIQLLREDVAGVLVRYCDGTEAPLSSGYFHRIYKPIP